MNLHEKTEEKKSDLSLFYFIVGGIFLIGGIYGFFGPNYGFSTSAGGEGLGYNFAHIGAPILGAWLCYKAIKTMIKK